MFTDKLNGRDMSKKSFNRHSRYRYIPITERPEFEWPEEKRLAVYICNNVEVFSFPAGTDLNLGPQTSMETIRDYAWKDYGNRVGLWNLFDLLDEYCFPASHNVNGKIFEECPQIAQRIVERGDEFIAHGRTNSERQDQYKQAEESKLIAESAEAIRKFTGEAPKGWLGPFLAQTSVTPDLLKELGFHYQLDWPADDQPFWINTQSGPILSVPYSVELNDVASMVYRQHSVSEFERMLIDQFDEMLEQSNKWSLVYSIVLHPYVTGQPHRLRSFRRVLTHIEKYRDQVWITTPGRIADYFAEKISPT